MGALYVSGHPFFIDFMRFWLFCASIAHHSGAVYMVYILNTNLEICTPNTLFKCIFCT